jgi:hypothetical protein
MVQLTFVLSVCLYAQSPAANVTSKYHFTTPQTPESLNEAVTLVQHVASVPQVSVDISAATLHFTGPAEATDFAAWLLPRIDRAAGNGTFVQQYKLTGDYVGRVNFLVNVEKPQETQELLTVLRTVADVQYIYPFTSNHALVMRGKDWEMSFAEWIIEQLDQPIQAKPDPATREFTVGGPDYRGMGHGARINFLANMTSPLQAQELLTVVRTVSDIQKVFSYSARHALVLRAGDTDLKRAEWIIQQLDAPATQPAGNRTFTVPSGDDVTRVFPLHDATRQWIQSAVTSLRSEYKIMKLFPTMAPANIVVRGTSEQIAAAATWLTTHNALTE